MIFNEVVCNNYDTFVLVSMMLVYLNEFHNYFILYLPNAFLVIFIMFNHSLKRWHSSVGLTILSICKWYYCNKCDFGRIRDALGRVRPSVSLV